ncbi:non-specific lipid-transfer protein A-like [Pistacia vera]|uniref:non-specific lipid-transfer protein A-like n=1 Tax=Pistacia vera TaxID=55513 RepID=UPI001263D649|nr:non-specific lipid-transfer protein A-like [Pistacia vera]
MPYLEAAAGNPSTACCDGVRNIKAITPTTADRQAACECVKSAAAKYPNINQDAASSLPGKFGAPLNIPTSKNTNCANIN